MMTSQALLWNEILARKVLKMSSTWLGLAWPGLAWPARYTPSQRREVVQIVANFFAAKIDEKSTKIDEKSPKITKNRKNAPKSAQERPRASQRARKSTLLSSWGRLGTLLCRPGPARTWPRASKFKPEANFSRFFSVIFYITFRIDFFAIFIDFLIL